MISHRLARVVAVAGVLACEWTPNAQSRPQRSLNTIVASPSLTQLFAAVRTSPQLQASYQDLASAYERQGFTEAAALATAGAQVVEGARHDFQMTKGARPWTCESPVRPGIPIGAAAESVAALINGGRFEAAKEAAAAAVAADPDSCDNLLEWARATLYMAALAPKDAANDQLERASRLFATAGAWGVRPTGLMSNWAVYAELSRGLSAVGVIPMAYAAVCQAIAILESENSGENLEATRRQLVSRQLKLEQQLAELQRKTKP
jgi:tetratricopeptide (TPR) repeat protein